MQLTQLQFLCRQICLYIIWTQNLDKKDLHVFGTLISVSYRMITLLWWIYQIQASDLQCLYMMT